MKKRTKLILAGLLVIGGIGVLGSMGEEEQVTKQEPKQEVAVEETVESSEVEVEETASESVELSSESKETLRRVMINTYVNNMIENSKDSFDYVDVEYKEESNNILMSVAQNGLASFCSLMQAGLMEKTEWETITESSRSTSEILKEQVDEIFFGDYESVDITIAILNDQNKENVLYMATNGVTTFDALNY